jgi:membrane protein DedA with SNARE-associated domain
VTGEARAEPGPVVGSPPPLSPFERARLTVMLGVVGVLFVGSLIGQALSPTLANDAPLLLITLNPRNSFLLLVSHEVPFGAFFAVGFVRLVIGDPVLYLLGFWYGLAARNYLVRQGGWDTLLSWLDRWFPRIGPVIVFAAPNTTVCLLAGISRMRPALFAVLNVTGTATRLLLIWWLGDVFHEEVDWFLDFLSRYQWPATAVMVGLVLVQVSLSRRKGTGELEQLERMGDEITSGSPPPPSQAE